MARSPEPGEDLGAEAMRAASVRKPLLRIGGRVVTQDGFFAKIVGISGQDPLLLDLEVVGIGLRAGVPVSQVTTSDRRSVPLSPRKRRSLSPAGVPRRAPATTGRRPGKGRAASSANDQLQVLDTSLEEEKKRFKKTSDVLESILSENTRLQSMLEKERELFGSPLKVSDSSPPAAPIALSFEATKKPVVPILKLPGVGVRKEAPSPISGSPRCLSPRVAIAMGEHRRHTFSKVLYMCLLSSTCNRALTFENMWQAPAGVCTQS